MTTLDAPAVVRGSLGPERLARLVALVRSTSGETRTTHSPLDGQLVAEVPVSSIDDVDESFAAARAAQVAWAQTSYRARRKALLRLHDLVLEHQDELLDLIQIESGKSRQHAYDEVAHVALTARFYARRLAKQLKPRRRNGVLPTLTSVTVNQVPKGVVGIIAPWNYPLTMALSDGLPAIAAGNAVVLKPDSQTPLVALAGVELLRRAGIPADVWQVVSGAGSVVGTAIIQRADYVCFTGSTATGKIVAQQASERLISASLELGGKNPMVVLPGADLDKAAAGAVQACFSSAGQLCVSIERIYVPREHLHEFSTAFVSRVERLSLGASLDWDAEVGSLISQGQLDTVTSHVADAVAKGATVLTGGTARPDLGPYFYEPTVLTDVPVEAECFADETFGPLVSLYPYDTVEEAVDLANAGDYGLNASVWGKPRHARTVAARIKAGTVNINEGFGATFGSVDAPMGGMRQSGLGRRQGAEGILRYTEPQSVGVQRLVPVAGPAFIRPETYAKLLTLGLKVLRRTPRA
ncbi:succinic semialdehyde dehydrogenase [Aeromicrobium fastidiosum]|uniref:succinate-semialdehyde dehydrogenase (NADP(+)) n=1 Tax=Aeromicrobium fastidiosum TaxID=52699 RepID=A0A641AL07_9ACTN|nr:succinic semialdehyde dehydrogenase [Aeromicrobium fastidiosum]KAA1374646.1 succinate-semialdehyde dehydrogenase (NADP(+)) [Aeromicrobium fastidiosum]MBP2390809.1 succinate-semialdehyde dehydrogenase/glutarate-semialdehyde dehydrogenase [Aeromicrobium fastidiosum]